MDSNNVLFCSHSYQLATVSYLVHGSKCVHILDCDSQLDCGNKSKSKLLYDWQFPANQFIWAPSPVRLMTRDFWGPLTPSRGGPKRKHCFQKFLYHCITCCLPWKQLSRVVNRLLPCNGQFLLAPLFWLSCIMFHTCRLPLGIITIIFFGRKFSTTNCL
jgi:hypothetical protein